MKTAAKSQRVLWSLLVITMLGAPVLPTLGDEPPERILYVPFEDLPAILGGPNERVFLGAKEYAELKRLAQRQPAEQAPAVAWVSHADYVAGIDGPTARIRGELQVQVLQDGWHGVPLTSAGVRLLRATLDQQPAPIGRSKNGDLILFVHGVGAHRLELEMQTDVTVSSALQSLTFRLPPSAAAELTLTVPGNVDVKSGTEVAQRRYDLESDVTTFRLQPRRGTVQLAVSLNNRRLRADRLIVARSSFVSEVTPSFERLHATIAMDVVHGATDEFAFQTPEGFQITAVSSPRSTQWRIDQADSGKVLVVRLREPVQGVEVVQITAIRSIDDLGKWRAPRLVPRDVAAHAAIVGLVAERRLKPHAISPEQLVPLDAQLLARVLPQVAGDSHSQLRPIAAFYSPTGEYGMQADLRSPPQELETLTHLLLHLDELQFSLTGGFTLTPRGDRLRRFTFRLPAGWSVKSVFDDANQRLPYERFESAGEQRFLVTLPSVIEPGTSQTVYFRATRVDSQWLSPFERFDLTFPNVTVENSAHNRGAIAVAAYEDVAVAPDTLVELRPLDASQRTEYGLLPNADDLAYEFLRDNYQARFVVTRKTPSVAARVYTFAKVAEGVLNVHYEVFLDVRRSRMRDLTLALPATTPGTVQVDTIPPGGVKETEPRVEGEERLWHVRLAQATKGLLKLTANFEQRLDTDHPLELTIPRLKCVDAAYQNDMLAIEGDAALDIDIETAMRVVDVGELAEAQYVPGRRLLGVFASTPSARTASVRVVRRKLVGLPPAIVQRAEIVTVVSSDGTAQSAARYLLRTKVPLLMVKLPPEATLWSATQDNVPLQPRKRGDDLLLSLNERSAGVEVDIRLIYEMPLGGFHRIRSELALSAPELSLLQDEKGQPQTVPQADLVWHLHLPHHVKIITTRGNVTPDALPRVGLPVREITQTALGTLLVYFGGALGEAKTAAAPARTPDFKYSFEKLADDGAPEEPPGPFGAMAERDQGGAEEADEELEAAAAGEMAPGLGGGGFGGGGFGGGGSPGSGRPTNRGQIPPQPNAAAGDAPARRGEPKSEATTKSANKQAESAQKNDSKYRYWALQGLRGVNIDFRNEEDGIRFRSLGESPQLAATVAHQGRVSWIAIGVSVLVFAYGLLLSGASIGRRLRYVGLVWTAALVLGAVGGEISAYNDVYAGSALAATLLVPFWIIWNGMVQVGSFVHWGRARLAKLAGLTTATMMLAMMTSSPAGAQDEAAAILKRLLENPQPVKIPDDAIVIPYRPDDPTSRTTPDRVLIPYQRYVQLWNLAHPDQKIGTRPLPARYAFSGARYELRLSEADHLELRGTLDVTVMSSDPVDVSLPLSNAVITSAELNGAPAALRAVPVPAAKKPAGPANAGTPVMLASVRLPGAGNHRLTLTIQVPIARQGGWRELQSVVPHGPATQVEVVVPQAATQIRRSLAVTGYARQTTDPDETIAWTLSEGGRLSIAWRPQVAPGTIDRSLTGESLAVVEIVSSGVKVGWRVDLSFGQQERAGFQFTIPPGYLVERVAGKNVRGWNIETADGKTVLTVELLKAAKQKEQLDIFLFMKQNFAALGQHKLSVPHLQVQDSALHRGVVALRKSPILDLQLLNAAGVARIEQPTGGELAKQIRLALPGPLGIADFRSFEFRASPFTLELSVRPYPEQRSGFWRILVREGETESALEAQVTISSRPRPLYRASLLLPVDLKLERVVAPDMLDWSLEPSAEGQVLTVFFANGQRGSTPILIEGRLADHAPDDTLGLPQLKLLGVESQPGQLVVQADPALDVRAVDTQRLQTLLISSVAGWLTPEQRRAVRLAFSFRAPDYAGRLQLVPRAPVVRCDSISNVRVTFREIEETILLDYSIAQAGVRQLVFTLPESLKEADITAPMIRRVERTATDDQRVRIALELQDAVIGQYRVLIRHDRALGSGPQPVPMPLIETGEATYRYVTLENAGRDELVVDQLSEFQAVERQSRPWQQLRQRLQGGNVTLAYVTTNPGPQAFMTFVTRQRRIIQTAGASIGLAQTTLVVDASGAYRGVMKLRVDNRTESTLEIELPTGAQLWAALVAGEPVKPAAPAAKKQRRLRIPLIKTAEGDLDYIVELKYAGKIDLPQNGARIRFPFIRTINIQTELSQVKLLLPPELRWLYFDGTASQVESEADFVAGYAAYRQRQLEQLAQVMKGKNVFSSIRALYNAKSLSQELATIGKISSVTSSAKSRAAVRRSRQLAEQVVQLGQQQVEQPADAGRPEFDNRAQLGKLVESQRNDIARNEVTRLRGNFRAPQAPRETGGERAKDQSAEWFLKNQLAAPTTDDNKPAAAAKEPAQQQAQLDVDGQAAAGGMAQRKRAAQNVFKSLPEEDAAQSPAAQTEEGRRDGQNGVADFYQRQVEQQHGRMQFQQGRGSSLDRVGGLLAEPQTAAPEDSATAAAGESGNEQPAQALGLASLDFEIPDRGTAFFFATPRGDVEIEARAVSQLWAQRSRAAGYAAVWVVAIWVTIAILLVLRPGIIVRIAGAAIAVLLAFLSLLLIAPIALLLWLSVAVHLLVQVTRERRARRLATEI